jgi:hypothetical protein
VVAKDRSQTRKREFPATTAIEGELREMNDEFGLVRFGTSIPHLRPECYSRLVVKTALEG